MELTKEKLLEDNGSLALELVVNCDLAFANSDFAQDHDILKQRRCAIAAGLAGYSDKTGWQPLSEGIMPLIERGQKTLEKHARTALMPGAMKKKLMHVRQAFKDLLLYVIGEYEECHKEGFLGLKIDTNKDFSKLQGYLMNNRRRLERSFSIPLGRVIVIANDDPLGGMFKLVQRMTGKLNGLNKRSAGL